MADVGVVQRGQHLGFPLEAGQPVRVGGERLGHLKRHVPVELGVAGLPDLAHPAFADLSGDGVGAEGGAGSERHRLVHGKEILHFFYEVLDEGDVLTIGSGIFPDHATSKMASTSTGMFAGSDAMPTALRPPIPLSSPKISTINSLKPFTT